MTHMLHARRASIGVAAAAVLAGCAMLPSSAELDAQADAMIQAGFRDEGIARLSRLQQDAAQKACSTGQPLPEAQARPLEAAALAAVQYPSDGRYLGDWREGEKLAQNGRGMTWTDSSDKPSANGGSCYNCHQIGKAEISYGTIGPSLYRYGRSRGVLDPAAPASAEVLRYTWAKIWNSKAFVACSNMPRFGHMHLQDEAQIRHLMALLLDPNSPVNE